MYMTILIPFSTLYRHSLLLHFKNDLRLSTIDSEWASHSTIFLFKVLLFENELSSFSIHVIMLIFECTFLLKLSLILKYFI